MDDDTIRGRLRSIVGADADVSIAGRALYASDASNYRVMPTVVVAPRTVDELAAVVRACSDSGTSLTMRGAGTSVAGNAIGPGVVVDASRHLGRIVEIDGENGTATVEPGVVLDDLNSAAAAHGLRVGPDPSTHSRCTVGGMIGNNACGAHSVRWGTTADAVLDLEVATPDGERRWVGSQGLASSASTGRSEAPIAERLRAFTTDREALIRRELPPWRRRVSGYALDWLLPERGSSVPRALVGSEGTCAVVTAATVRLLRPPAARGLVVIPFADDIAAAAAVPALLAAAPFTVESLTSALLHGSRDPALLPTGGAWLLVEAGGESVPEMREHATALADALGLSLRGADATLIEDAVAQAHLWRIREDGAGRAARFADGSPAWPGFEDAAVPPERLAPYLVELHELLREHDLRGTTYGHFGEGCIHLRVGFGLDRPGGVDRLAAFMASAGALVVRHGGTLSGEHGDGRARSALHSLQFHPDLLAAFTEWKGIWDPAHTLNPGVLVDAAPLEEDLRRPRPTLIDLQPSLAFGSDGHDLRAAVERCIGVGKCVTRQGSALMCPSYRATGRERDSTRGRARLLQEMAAGSLAADGWRSTAVLDALDLCLSCKGCLSECPTGVDMASYKAEFLHHHYRGRIRPRSHYSLGWLPTWLRLIHRIPGGASIANAVTGFGPTRRLFAIIAGLARERSIPKVARKTFVASFQRSVTESQGYPRVVLWPDTYTNHLTPEVGHAAARVLRAAGFDVLVPEVPVCCGLTWVTTGQLDRAKSEVRHTLSAPGLGGDEPVVVLEPSCAAALRRDLVELLPADPGARSLAGRVTTLAELLDRVCWRPPDHAQGSLAALVQPHCHQQAVLGTEADQRVMATAGIAPSMLDGCCGLAGNFGAEAGHESISLAVAELSLLPALRAADDDAVVIADGFSCRTQIAFTSGRRARHLAEVLVERLPA